MVIIKRKLSKSEFTFNDEKLVFLMTTVFPPGKLCWHFHLHTQEH